MIIEAEKSILNLQTAVQNAVTYFKINMTKFLADPLTDANEQQFKNFYKSIDIFTAKLEEFFKENFKEDLLPPLETSTYSFYPLNSTQIISQGTALSFSKPENQDLATCRFNNSNIDSMIMDSAEKVKVFPNMVEGSSFTRVFSFPDLSHYALVLKKKTNQMKSIESVYFFTKEGSKSYKMDENNSCEYISMLPKTSNFENATDLVIQLKVNPETERDKVKRLINRISIEKGSYKNFFASSFPPQDTSNLFQVFNTQTMINAKDFVMMNNLDKKKLVFARVNRENSKENWSKDLPNFTKTVKSDDNMLFVDYAFDSSIVETGEIPETIPFAVLKSLDNSYRLSILEVRRQVNSNIEADQIQGAWKHCFDLPFLKGVKICRVVLHTNLKIFMVVGTVKEQSGDKVKITIKAAVFSYSHLKEYTPSNIETPECVEQFEIKVDDWRSKNSIKVEAKQSPCSLVVMMGILGSAMAYKIVAQPIPGTTFTDSKYIEVIMRYVDLQSMTIQLEIGSNNTVLLDFSIIQDISDQFKKAEDNQEYGSLFILCLFANQNNYSVGKVADDKSYPIRPLPKKELKKNIESN